MNKTLLLAALLAAASSVASAADATATAAPSNVIEIHNMRFEPAALTVTAGTTVTWVNNDGTAHTISDRTKAFRSAALDTKDKFSFTFATPGDFTYFCTLHPMMVGKITVKPAGSSS